MDQAAMQLWLLGQWQGGHSLKTPKDLATHYMSSLGFRIVSSSALELMKLIETEYTNFKIVP